MISIADCGIMLEPQLGMSAADIVNMAHLTERLGFGYLFRSDHLLPTDGRRGIDSPECWTTLGAIAASTQKVKFGPLVSPVGFRNPALLAKIRSISPTVENQVVAFAQDGSLALSVNTLPTGDMAESLALDESERQNIQGIASLPSTTTEPKSSRVRLPIGEAVRITWSSSVVDPATGSSQQTNSIGYAIAKSHTLFVVVFTFDRGVDQASAIARIIETFAVQL